MDEKKERVLIYSEVHAGEIMGLVGQLRPDQRLKLICRSRPDSLLELLDYKNVKWEFIERGPTWWCLCIERRKQKAAP